MGKNQMTELDVNRKAKMALQNVIEMGLETEENFEIFCEELEMMKVNEEIYDYGELFEQALLQKGSTS